MRSMLTLVVLLLCACTPDADAPKPASAARAPVARAAPAVVTPPRTKPPSIAPSGVKETIARSEYTSLAPSDCVLTERDAESGATTHRCTGVGGYELRMHDTDARMSLDVLANGDVPMPLHFSQFGNGAFSSLGPRAEWRVAASASRPHALIVRYQIYEQPERATSYLLVVKLAPEESCVVAQLPPSPTQNQDARRVADYALSKTCLNPAGQASRHARR